MSLRHWHPFKEFNNLRQEINKLFEEMTHRHHKLRDWGRLSETNNITWSPAIAQTVKVDLLEAKAREAITQQRQAQEHQQETMRERAIEE
jgi:hypothetical protein